MPSSIAASLAYPPYDRAATRAALLVGRVQNQGDQRAVKALQFALGDEDATAIVGVWAADKLAQLNSEPATASEPKKSVTGGGWAAIIQLLIQNLPAIIALIESLINPPPPTPTPPAP